MLFQQLRELFEDLLVVDRSFVLVARPGLRGIDAVLLRDVIPLVHPMADRLPARGNLDVSDAGVREQRGGFRFKAEFWIHPGHVRLAGEYEQMLRLLRGGLCAEWCEQQSGESECCEIVHGAIDSLEWVACYAMSSFTMPVLSPSDSTFPIYTTCSPSPEL